MTLFVPERSERNGKNYDTLAVAHEENNYGTTTYDYDDVYISYYKQENYIKIDFERQSEHSEYLTSCVQCSRGDIIFYMDSKEHEIRLTYEDWNYVSDEYGDAHRSGVIEVEEYLYKTSDGKLYKYNGSAESWGAREAEAEWNSVISTVSDYLQKYAGIKFKPIADFSKYKSISEKYREPAITKIKCKDSISLNVNELTHMLQGDSVIYYFETDLNGDKKKDTVSLNVKCTGKGDYGENSYSITLRIGKKKIKTNCFSGGLYAVIKIDTFDINPKDKYTEVRVDLTEMETENLDFYRYTGKKVKRMVSAPNIAYSNIIILKQKNNDYLQCMHAIFVDGIGFVIIEADLNSKGIVNNKTYTVTSDYQKHEYTFNKSLTLYKNADGKNVSGYISVNDIGYITKVKIDKEDYASYVYIKLTNGKSGWIKIKGKGYNEGDNRIVTEPVVWG